MDLLERRKKSFAELYGPSGVSGVPAATRASVLRVRSIPADPSDAEIEAAYAKLEELVDRRNAARELKPQVVLVVGAVPDLAEQVESILVRFMCFVVGRALTIVVQVRIKFVESKSTRGHPGL